MATGTQSDPITIPSGGALSFTAPSDGTYWFTSPTVGYQELADVGARGPGSPGEARGWTLYGVPASGANVTVAGPATGTGNYRLATPASYASYLLAAELKGGEASQLLLRLFSEAP